MSSLIGELQRREAATPEEAEELRRRIAQLTGRLVWAEERLSRLVIIRETVEEVLNGAGQPNGADTCVRYLTSKQEFLRYDQALAACRPIATGSSREPAAT
jgi:hypothetical protein